VRLRAAVASGAVLALVGLSGCMGGETKKTGAIGDELSAEKVKVTVERVDREVPEPESDITGLSVPSSGYRLIGVRVNVCSGYEAAIGNFSFSLESSEGEARPKHVARNYDSMFRGVRDDCERGWLVYEIPRGASPTKVKFRFDESGNSRDQADNVEARFEWEVE
jgi:hypothetical protein